MIYIYAIPEWKWNSVDDEFWSAHEPNKCINCVDVATVPQMTHKINPANRGGYVAVYSERLPSRFDPYLIGSGDPTEMKPGQRDKDAWENVTKTKPQGETVADWLKNHLTEQSDPAGDAASKPLMPTHKLEVQIQFGRKLSFPKFRFDPSKPHGNRVKALLQRDNRQQFDRDQTHVRKVLDWQREKYRLGAFKSEYWKELADAEMLKNIDSLLKHETVITESFDGADKSGVGYDQSWTELSNTWDNNSNQLRHNTVVAGINAYLRCDTDLSGSDNYGQITWNSLPSANYGIACRYSNSANTAYWGRITTWASANTPHCRKVVAGTDTNLATGTTVGAHSAPKTIRVSASGSDVNFYWDSDWDTAVASVTDTAISSGLRGGVVANETATSKTADNFEAADLSGGGSSPPLGGRMLIGVGI